MTAPKLDFAENSFPPAPVSRPSSIPSGATPYMLGSLSESA